MRAVLERDLVAEGSRLRAFYARTAVGGLATLVVLVAAVVARGAPSQDVVGAGAFAFLQGLVFWFLCLATPALLVASVLVERRQHTLVLLLASPVTVRGIVLGKLIARLGTVLGWAAAALPPLAVLILFGGISLERLGNSVAAVLGAALEMTAWGLIVSCAARKLATGAVLAYLLPALHWLLARSLEAPLRGGGWPQTADLLAASTPFAAMLPPDQWPALFAGRGSPGPGTVYLGFALVLAAAAVPLAVLLLSREEETASRTRTRLPRLRGEDRFRRLLTGGNPVAWKESLLLDTAWSRFLYYLVGALFLLGEVLFLWFHRTGDWDAAWNHAYAAGCFTALAVLAAVLGATGMSYEKTHGTLDILRVTPLTSRQIVNGKVVGSAVGLGFLALLPAAHLALSVVTGLMGPAAALFYLVAGALYAANYAVHGIAWGTVARTPFTAVLGGASLLLFGFSFCWALCLAGPVLLLLASLKKEEVAKKTTELLIIPGALCGSPYFVLESIPPALDAWLGDRTSSSALALGGFSIFGLFSLAATAVFLATRYGILPSMLQREFVEMTRGEGPRIPGLRRTSTGVEWIRRRLQGRGK